MAARRSIRIRAIRRLSQVVIIGLFGALLPAVPASSQAQPEPHPAQDRRQEPAEEERHAPPPRYEPPTGRPAHPLGEVPGPDASVAGFEEVTSLREESVRFFGDTARDPHVAQLFTEPISFKNAAGEWQAIDNRLVPVTGGYANATNAFQSFFPNRLSPDNPVSIRYPEGSLSFALTGTAPTEITTEPYSATYHGVRPGVDLAFDMTTDGVKERAILHTEAAARRLEYRISTSGLTLEAVDGNEIAVLSQGQVMAYFAAPFAHDSSKDPLTGEPATTYDVAMELRREGPNVYALALEIDPAWLRASDRVFPVTLDPTVAKTRCGYPGSNCGAEELTVPLLKDTYVQDGETQVVSDKGWLRAGFLPTESRTFMTWGLNQIRDVGDLVYDADFDIYSYLSNQNAPGNYQLRRITDDWDEFTTTWTTNRPIVDSHVWATNTGCSATTPWVCDNRWLGWDITDLVQFWVDVIPTSDNHGFELSHPSAADPKPGQNFFSGDYAGDLFKRPYIVAWVNAMPGTKAFVRNDPDWPKLALGADAPESGATVLTTTPTLEIKDLTDANGDPIVVRYQVSTSQTDFETFKVYDSKWIDETHSHRIPAGVLTRNRQYFWRVQASDICPTKYIDPDTSERDGTDICDDLDQTGVPDQRPTSEVRAIKVGGDDSNMGTDRRWAMWSQGLGNDMELSVNTANGNMVLQYPFDSIGTPSRPLNIHLAYNSQKALRVANGDEDEAPALPAGWDLAAGPVGRHQMPSRLETLGTDTYGVAIITQSGKRELFAKAADGLFVQVGPYGGTVRQLKNSTWLLTTYSGGTYVFDSTGNLDKARPSTTTPGSPGFDYDAPNGRVTSVTDPLGREVQFTYGPIPGAADEVLTQVTALAATDPESISWTIGYDASGLINKITDPEGAVVNFDYDGGRLTEVMDGAEFAKPSGGSATKIAYTLDTKGRRVSSITLPTVDTVAPSSLRATTDYGTEPSTAAWGFSYTPTDFGDFATTTTITSPRGQRTSGGTMDSDYQTIIDFNDIGLPILEQGPVPAGAPARPTTKRVWDFATGNLLCHRGPGANEVSSKPCMEPDGMQTQYEYQTRAPFLLTKVTHPRPTDVGSRLVRTLTYDGDSVTGDPFEGLQAHYFHNPSLTGLADAFDIGDLNTDWVDSGPAQLGGDSDFSVRYFGDLLPFHASGLRDYEFRLTAEDEARLIIGEKMLLDCITSLTGPNCPGGVTQTALRSDLGTGAVPIIVELQAATGPAQIKLEWKDANGTFVPITKENFRPDTDVLTSEKEGTPEDPAAFSTRTYAYPSADDKVRGLPKSETTNEPDFPAHKMSYTYDEHGRVLDEIDATGATITHHYGGACEDRTLDRVGLETTRSCNAFGDVESETVHVEGMLGGVTTQSRTTTTTYTELGRVDRVTFADRGFIDYDHDKAGRLIRETQLQEETEPQEEGLTRVTEFIRNARGWVTEERLPDPDRTGPVPSIQYRYDDDGNPIVRIDERGQQWVQEFDEGGRRFEKIDPLDNKWTWAYDAAGRVTTKTDPPTTTTEPHGVVVTFAYDALDRVTSRMLGSLDPKVTEYDERGLVIRQEDPDHVVTTFTHDAFGNVRSETAMVGTDANGNPLAKTRTDSYDNRGFLTERTDFDGNPTLYTYDDMGHLTTVKLPHDPPNVTTYDLNEAGEVERVTRPGATPQSPAITRAYDYDKMGRVVADKSGDDTAWSFIFNQAGEQIQAVDPRGFALETTYDGAGRATTRAAYHEVGASSPLSSVTFTYDRAGNMTAATNETGQVAATYDNAGRIATVEASGHTTTSTYLGVRLSSRSDAGGTTEYHYEPTTGRVGKITDSLTGTDVWFQYFDSGKVKSHQDGNGLTSTYRYDAAGRPDLQEVRNTTGEVVARFASGYDPDSHVTSRSRVVDDGDFEGPDNGVWTYGYDDAGRLTSATDPDGVAFDYGYDPAGNRIEVKETRTLDNPSGGAPVTEIRSTKTGYDSASRPLSSTLTVTTGDISVGPVETTYGHDGAGNLTRIEGPEGYRSFGYDEWGRMETATTGLPGDASPVRYGYTYDALDRTVLKETRAGVDGGDAALIRELYWYAGLDPELVRSATEGPELAPAEIETVKYSYRLGAPYAVEKAIGVDDPALGLERKVTTSFLGSGPHGDVSYSTESDGDLSGARSYDPWGVPLTDSGDNSDLGYQGDHTDPDTGLVDMGARFYLPELGRFTTVDPLSGSLMDPLSQNPYIYGADDPVSETDPTGMCARSDCPPDHAKRGTRSTGSGVGVAIHPIAGIAVSIGTEPNYEFNFDSGRYCRYTPLYCDDPEVSREAGLTLALALMMRGGAIGVQPLPARGMGAGSVTVRASGTLDEVAAAEKHLAEINALDYPFNRVMIERIRTGIASGRRLTSGEGNFLTHELTEANAMRHGFSQLEAHELAGYTHPTYANYDPAVIKQFPEWFNHDWVQYWKIGN